MELMYSAATNKLYLSGLEGEPPRWKSYVISLSAPTAPIERLNRSLGTVPDHIVVNDKLRRGYGLVDSGVLKVFSTESDTLVSTSKKPSCVVQVIAISQQTGMVYGGGTAGAGDCLVLYDPDGHIVRENALPHHTGKQNLVQRIVVDSASGDVIYQDPDGVGRADQSLTEKWRAPVADANDLGFEPKTNTVYVPAAGFPVITPTNVAVIDGTTGKQTGQFTGPGWGSGFAPFGDGRLFAAFFNSSDLFVLSDGSSTLTKFASLGDVPKLTPHDPKWLAIDPIGHRLFVSPGGEGNQILVYRI